MKPPSFYFMIRLESLRHNISVSLLHKGRPNSVLHGIHEELIWAFASRYPVQTCTEKCLSEEGLTCRASRERTHISALISDCTASPDPSAPVKSTMQITLSDPSLFTEHFILEHASCESPWQLANSQQNIPCQMPIKLHITFLHQRGFISSLWSRFFKHPALPDKLLKKVFII